MNNKCDDTTIISDKNWKMRCLDSKFSIYTEGKIYSVIDGVVTYDSGSSSCSYDSFDDFSSKSIAKWELVDDEEWIEYMCNELEKASDKEYGYIRAYENKIKELKEETNKNLESTTELEMLKKMVKKLKQREIELMEHIETLYNHIDKLTPDRIDTKIEKLMFMNCEEY